MQKNEDGQQITNKDDFDKIKKSFYLLRDVRNFLEKEFKVRQSTIGLDISIVVLNYYFEKSSPLTVKNLFAESKHSPTGIRYHLDGLLEDGWICKDKGINDKRISVLNPGDKLLGTIVKFTSSYEKS